MKKYAFLGLITAIILTVTTGCLEESSAGKATVPLKVGTLSMMTVLPLYAAQEEGLFRDQDVDVEIVPFRSQIERDTALVAGQIDCVIEDIYSAPVFNQDRDLIKVVAVSPVRSYMFAIVASSQSRIKSLADLKDTAIASSLGNIIEYVTDRMCERGGLKVESIQKTNIASMPLRLEMLSQNKVEIATFSRPLSDMALRAGGRIIYDDNDKSLLTSSIMVSSATLKDRPEDIKNFLKAWSAAAENISANPAGYRDILADAAGISPDIADSIDVPQFDKLRLPDEEEYLSKMVWNLEKKNISKSIPYKDIVTGGYIPE